MNRRFTRNNTLHLYVELKREIAQQLINFIQNGSAHHRQTRMSQLVEIYNNMTRYNIEDAIEQFTQVIQPDEMSDADESFMKLNLCINYDEMVDFSETECAVCYEALENPTVVKINCGHMFCAPCVKKQIFSQMKCGQMPNCALCRAEYTVLYANDTNVSAIIESISEI